MAAALRRAGHDGDADARCRTCTTTPRGATPSTRPHRRAARRLVGLAEDRDAVGADGFDRGVVASGCDRQGVVAWRHRARLPVPGHDADLEVVRYGAWGRPVLLFPSEAGSARDAEGNGMLDAVRPLVDAGRISLFCVDSLDGRSWADNDMPDRGARPPGAGLHGLALGGGPPWVLEQCGGGQEVVTVGVSLGAYHAVHLTLQRADLAPLAIGLSGNYDPTTWNGWGELGDATYFANPTAYVANMDGDHLDWIRSRVSVLLVVGRGRSRCRRPGRCPPPERSQSCCAQGNPPRARRVGPRQRPRLAVVAAPAGPPPAPLRLTAVRHRR